jgi:prolyl-tRNA synthetase
VHVLAFAGGSGEVSSLAEALAAELSSVGHDVLLDDRDARPGEKFADADLLGCPIRVTVGKKSLDDGAVDVRRRSDGVDARVERGSVVGFVSER